MKVFKFEIILTEEDLAGDEFWEGAIERDGTGIADVTEALEQAITESNLIMGSSKEVKDVIRLISYKDQK